MKLIGALGVLFAWIFLVLLVGKIVAIQVQPVPEIPDNTYHGNNKEQDSCNCRPVYRITHSNRLRGHDGPVYKIEGFVNGKWEDTLSGDCTDYKSAKWIYQSMCHEKLGCFPEDIWFYYRDNRDSFWLRLW